MPPVTLGGVNHTEHTEHAEHTEHTEHAGHAGHTAKRISARYARLPTLLMNSRPMPDLPERDVKTWKTGRPPDEEKRGRKVGVECSLFE